MRHCGDNAAEARGRADKEPPAARAHQLVRCALLGKKVQMGVAIAWSWVSFRVS